MRFSAGYAAAGLLLILIPLAGSQPLAACVPGVGLWEQVESSDLIVLAKVEAVEPTLLGRCLEDRGRLFERAGRLLWLKVLEETIRSSWGEPSLARLMLLPSESWKGPLPRHLRVGIPWAAMPREGGEFLIFAHRGFWGWTLGRMVPRAFLRECNALGELRGWIEEAADLQRRSPESREAKIEWLLRGVSTPSLRRLAVYELLAEVHPHRSRREKPPSLPTAQQAVIAAAFVADPPRDSSLIPTLHLLAGYDDPLVDQLLLSQIQELLAEECLKPWSLEALRLALDRFGAQEALRRLEAEQRWPVDVGEIRRIWRLGVQEAARWPRCP